MRLSQAMQCCLTSSAIMRTRVKVTYDKFEINHDNDDDEVRYDEIGPYPTAGTTDQNQLFKLPNQRKSEVSDKIASQARFEIRRGRQPIYVGYIAVKKSSPEMHAQFS